MTLAAQLLLRYQSVEYFVAIEGVGWKADDADPTIGFDGVLFATANLDDLQGDLEEGGLTVYSGLQLPRSITDEFDPITLDYKPGGLGFEIVDADNWWRDNFNPLGFDSRDVAELGTALAYQDTTVQITDDGNDFANGDVIWVAGREAIRLAGKAAVAGSTYNFVGSARGHLGTWRGRRDASSHLTYAHGWATGTAVYPSAVYWSDLRVRLYAHIPGDAPVDAIMIYEGKIRGLSFNKAGTTVQIQTVAELFPGERRTYSPARAWYLAHVQTVGSNLGGRITESGTSTGTNGMGFVENVVGSGGASWAMGSVLPRISMTLGWRTDPLEQFSWFIERYALSCAYTYRQVEGGFAGMAAAIGGGFNTQNPQAITDATNWLNSGPAGLGWRDHLIDSVISVGGLLMRALYHRIDLMTAAAAYPGYRTFDAEMLYHYIPELKAGEATQIRFLLDSLSQNWRTSKWQVNRQIRRNVVDVLLIWLTSFSQEWEVWDCSAVDFDFDTLTFAAAPGNWDTDQYAGYALHVIPAATALNAAAPSCESRLIVSNTADTITVDTPFSATPLNYECQVRNSIYDVLPHPWGLQVHNSQIDIESFENVRDRYLRGVDTSPFILAESKGSDLDVWQFLLDNLCRTYGILCYRDRATGKLSARYCGAAAWEDSIANVSTAITDDDLLPGSLESLDFMSRPIVAEIELRTRDNVIAPVRPIYDTARTGVQGRPDITGYETTEITGLATGGKSSMILRVDDAVGALSADSRRRVTFDAQLNTINTLGPAMAQLTGRLAEIGGKPVVTSSIKVSLENMLDIQAGSLISLSSTATGLYNPFTHTAGFVSQLCRVTSVAINLQKQDPHLECEIQILPVANGALIAPACTVTAKGTLGGGEPYFEVSGADYAFSDASFGFDWEGLKVADRLELRDLTGAYKSGPHVIASFGTNQAATTALAADFTIVVTAAIVPAIATGDYVTFSPWVSASNTANMDLFSAYADAGEALDSDRAKVYS